MLTKIDVAEFAARIVTPDQIRRRNKGGGIAVGGPMGHRSPSYGVPDDRPPASRRAAVDLARSCIAL
jgi:hypothetical protein